MGEIYGKGKLMDRAVFLDVNLWCDYFLPRRDGNEIAFKLIEYCLKNDYLLLSASCSMKDLYYILQMESKREIRAAGEELTEKLALVAKDEATACVDAVTNMATLVAVSHNDVRAARIMCKEHPDFEDNVIAATAMRVEPLMFVTADKDFAKHASLPALTALQALSRLKELDAA